MKPVLRDGVIMNAGVLTADEVINQRLVCPACGVFEFQMWSEVGMPKPDLGAKHLMLDHLSNAK